VLGKQGVGLFVYRAPKFSFGEFLGRESFRKQGVKFVWCPGKTRRSTPFDGGQGSLDNFLNRLTCTATHNRLKPPFLFWRKVDGHGGLDPRARFLPGRLLG
jgi:hypothetical protein